MPLLELSSSSALRDFITQHATPGCVVTFSAHWCGPCKASKPALQQLAIDNPHSAVAIIYESDLANDIVTYNVRAFPTYVLYKNRIEVRRVEGANLGAVQALITECQNRGQSIPLTGGETLGGGKASSTLSAADARAARLARLSVTAPPPPASSSDPSSSTATGTTTTTTTTDATTTTAVEPMQVDAPSNVPVGGDGAAPDDHDAAADPMNTEEDEEKEGAIEVTDPVAHLDAQALATLTEAMGFPLLRAQKGLLYGTGGTLEGAVEWLDQHQDDVDIDDPIPIQQPASTLKAQSYKCNECGKILSNMANLELHANKTGHSDFEESTQHVVPLTEAEKAAKIAEIKHLLKAKRTERENQEKEEEKEREKQRRFMGQEMAKTREQLEQEQRKRENMLRKKEKEDAKRERERIRAELAKDKAERAANKGKLQSKLGVEGYHPDAIQYDVDEAGHPVDQAAHHHKTMHASAAKIDTYIDKVSSYKAGGDGGKCLKILKAYVGNAADHPNEDKYKSINTENNVFKTKVKPFLGAKNILLAVGFEPNDGGDALVLSSDANLKLLTETKAKLEAAMTKYGV